MCLITGILEKKSNAGQTPHKLLAIAIMVLCCSSSSWFFVFLVTGAVHPLPQGTSL